MNEEDFFNLLPEGNIRWFAQQLKSQLTRIDGISVYHTNTNDGDLRVRIGNEGRVIMTMYWQVNNESFFCRAYVDTHELQQHPVIDIQTTPDYQPLQSSFRVSNCFDTDSEMIFVICSIKEIAKKAMMRIENNK